MEENNVLKIWLIVCIMISDNCDESNMSSYARSDSTAANIKSKRITNP